MARGLLPTLSSRLPRLRTFLLFFIVFWALLGAFIIYLFISILFNYALPIRRAGILEIEYLYTLGAADWQEILQSRSANVTSAPTQNRVRGLIEDVPQLHYWRIPTTMTYDEWLGLWNDGLAWGEYKGREYWIYFGGTHSSPTSSSSTHDTSIFRHRYRQHSCQDPLEMCDAYNEAFNRISARWHGELHPRPYPHQPATSTALLRYVDCDISPLLCSNNFGVGVNAVQIAHLKFGNVCDRSMGVERCSVTWSFFGLPMREAPWTRMLRTQLNGGGSTIVPAFPDAEEQLWTLMSQAGAVEGMKYYDYDLPPSDFNPFWNVRIQVDPVPGEMRGRWSQPKGLDTWGLLRGMWLDNLLGFPRELLVRCYLTKWLDLLLNWWDGSPHVVQPQSCKGVEAENDRTRKAMGARKKLIDKHGLDPRNVFVA